MEIFTPIMPVRHKFYNCRTRKLLHENHCFENEALDLKSIAFYAATGFFFDDRTYYKYIRLLPAASKIITDDMHTIQSITPYWNWYYNPVIHTLEEATEAFAATFEKYLFDEIKNKRAILPLSGGMDSRTIAAAIPEGMKDITTYSYQFCGGENEVKYGRAIAQAKNLPFLEYEISAGYLWKNKNIEELSDITSLYNEFTHSRQMAVIGQVEKLGEIFLLGHGGELFKLAPVDKNWSFEQLADDTVDGALKCGGLELGKQLWKHWGLEGNFFSFVRDTVAASLGEVKIDNVRARRRAYLYKNFVIRQSTVNLNIFSRKNEILLPFWHKAMFDLVCSTQEDLLVGRQVQINYIKQKSPALASVPWQNYTPLNLYNYQSFSNKTRLPYRAAHALQRKLKEKLLNKKFIRRNWELQFLGEENDKQLRQHLFDSSLKDGLLPGALIKDFYQKFRYNPEYYAHPISMLLTLSCFKTSSKVMASY